METGLGNSSGYPPVSVSLTLLRLNGDTVEVVVESDCSIADLIPKIYRALGVPRKDHIQLTFRGEFVDAAEGDTLNTYGISDGAELTVTNQEKDMKAKVRKMLMQEGFDTRLDIEEIIAMSFACSDETILGAAKLWTDAFPNGSLQHKLRVLKMWGHVSLWNVSAVTKMSNLFAGKDMFNEDLSAWDVSQVKDMEYMFCGATSFNGDVSAWDVSQVSVVGHMFDEATSFNGDLSAWDVSQVSDMKNMFIGATSFNSDLSRWNVAQVSYMQGMFEKATSFKADLSAWDVSMVTTKRMTRMFADCPAPRPAWYTVVQRGTVNNKIHLESLL